MKLTRIAVGLFTTVLSIVGGAVSFSPVYAQNYTAGQSVEVDISGINSWEPGTVIPFLPGDSQDGYQVRVKVPRYSLYPDGMMVQKIHMRAAAAPAAAPPRQQGAQAPATPNANVTVKQPPNAWEPIKNPRPFLNPAAAPPADPAPNQGRGPAGRFNPGDHVEIDKAKINSWEGATVLPFEGNDPRDGPNKNRWLHDNTSWHVSAY